MRNIDINNYNKESWWSSHISWTPAVLFDASLHLHMRVCPCTRFSVSIKWKGQKMSISAQLDIVAMHWFITECVYVFPHRENISMYWTHKRQPFFWKIFVSLDEITEWVKLVTEYSTAEFLSKLVIVSQRGKSPSPTLSCRHACAGVFRFFVFLLVVFTVVWKALTKPYHNPIRDFPAL